MLEHAKQNIQRTSIDCYRIWCTRGHSSLEKVWPDMCKHWDCADDEEAPIKQSLGPDSFLPESHKQKKRNTSIFFNHSKTVKEQWILSNTCGKAEVTPEPKLEKLQVRDGREEGRDGGREGTRVGDGMEWEFPQEFHTGRRKGHKGEQRVEKRFKSWWTGQDSTVSQRWADHTSTWNA